MAGEVNGSERVPTWSRLAEVPRVWLDRRNLTQAIATAAVVGTILFLINQADAVFGGRATAATWLRIALTYLVPFGVCSYGILLGSRRSRAG